jgi:NNP family nitrate/nitrite transporter-like MFS transporter
MAATVVLFWLFSHSDPAHLVPSQVSFTDQLKALKDPRVLKYCQYYSKQYWFNFSRSSFRIRYIR